MFSLFSRPMPSLVGVDIGSSHIKAVMLQRDDRGYRISLARVVPVDGDSRDAAMARLGALLPKAAVRAAAAVSGATVMTKVITMDASLSDDDLETQIEIEADSLIPYPLDEVNLDFEPVGSPTPTGRMEVLLSACRSEDVQARVAALAAAGLKAEVIDVEGYALGRAQALLEEHQQGDLALVEPGAQKTLLAVNQGGGTRFVREISLERAQFPDRGDWEEQLAQQLQRSLQIYLSGGEDRVVPRLVLCCEHSDTLVAHLKQRLHMPCETAQVKCCPGVRLASPGQCLLACGLAMREAP